jgi:hypothetical protein
VARYEQRTHGVCESGDNVMVVLHHERNDDVKALRA